MVNKDIVFKKAQKLNKAFEILKWPVVLGKEMDGLWQ